MIIFLTIRWYATRASRFITSCALFSASISFAAMSFRIILHALMQAECLGYYRMIVESQFIADYFIYSLYYMLAAATRLICSCRKHTAADWIFIARSVRRLYTRTWSTRWPYYPRHKFNILRHATANISHLFTFPDGHTAHFSSGRVLLTFLYWFAAPWAAAFI